MLKLLKSLVKDTFPQSVLRWRARNLIADGLDLDLLLLANFRKYLAEIPEGGRLLERVSIRSACIDVGACGGEYSIIMADMFSRVLTIEPTFDMAEVLRKSLPHNCEVLECALGETCGEVALRVPKVCGARMHALATIADHGFAFSNIGLVETHTVRQLTVDQVVAERTLSPSLVKIDVEGYEGNVLKGSKQVMQKLRPVFMVEIEQRHNEQFKEIFSSFGASEYVPYHFFQGRLCVSGPEVVEKSYEYLCKNETAGTEEIMALKKTERYINNFVFVPKA